MTLISSITVNTEFKYVSYSSPILYFFLNLLSFCSTLPLIFLFYFLGCYGHFCWSRSYMKRGSFTKREIELADAISLVLNVFAKWPFQSDTRDAESTDRKMMALGRLRKRWCFFKSMFSHFKSMGSQTQKWFLRWSNSSKKLEVPSSQS